MGGITEPDGLEFKVKDPGGGAEEGDSIGADRFDAKFGFEQFYGF
jgi:hypothetical protein